ncbi:Eukaryotic translation initiation factor 2B (eIF-2B) family protein, partial [Thalictrum thalictroides]
GRPDRTGLRLSNELAKLDVPVKLLIDSVVAYTMDEVDMVFAGADGVVESGDLSSHGSSQQVGRYVDNDVFYADSLKVLQLVGNVRNIIAPFAIMGLQFTLIKVEIEKGIGVVVGALSRDRAATVYIKLAGCHIKLESKDEVASPYVDAANSYKKISPK